MTENDILNAVCFMGAEFATLKTLEPGHCVVLTEGLSRGRCKALTEWFRLNGPIAVTIDVRPVSLRLGGVSL